MLSIYVSNEDKEFIKHYAKMKKISVSEFIRTTVLEKIEDELDLIAYKKAMQEYKENPQAFTFEEVKEMLFEK